MASNNKPGKGTSSDDRVNHIYIGALRIKTGWEPRANTEATLFIYFVIDKWNKSPFDIQGKNPVKVDIRRSLNVDTLLEEADEGSLFDFNVKTSGNS